MRNLEAPAEINEAWTNLVFAGTLLIQGNYDAAASALRDAERHYQRAQSAARAEQSVVILTNLKSLRGSIDQTRSDIKVRWVSFARDNARKR
jgi:hypothetical protein